jgi:hypothetical protein
MIKKIGLNQQFLKIHNFSGCFQYYCRKGWVLNKSCRRGYIETIGKDIAVAAKEMMVTFGCRSTWYLLHEFRSRVCQLCSAHIFSTHYTYFAHHVQICSDALQILSYILAKA